MANRLFIFCLVVCLSGLVSTKTNGGGGEGGGGGGGGRGGGRGGSNPPELGVKLGAEPPSEMVAPRSGGRGLLLPCGPPPSGTTISWTKDGLPLDLVPSSSPPSTSQRIWLASNGSLVFNKVLHKKKEGGGWTTDGGVYRCIARNKNGGLISRPSRLMVPVLSSDFSTSPESLTVREGDVVRLTCSVESAPPAVITWLKDNHPLLPHTKRFTALDSGVLYISNIKEEDVGNYSCEAHNPYIKRSTPRSEPGQLRVVKGGSSAGGGGGFGGKEEGGSPPKLTFLPDSPPADLTGKAGRTLLLVCAASASPHPSPRPVLVWTQIKPDGTNSSLQTTNSGLNVLKLSKLSHSVHSGVYLCTATLPTKDTPTVTIDRRVAVTVETPAQIVEKPKTQIFPAAKTVRIDCEVRGHPPPQVVWYKDGVKLTINGRIKQNSRQLVIGGVVSQDTGVYQCFAGQQGLWAAGRLIVNSSPDQPLPPANLSCSPLSPSQIQLSWSPVQSGVQAYTIHYFPTEGGEEQKEVSPNYTYNVQKLQPYTNYTFYIRSYMRSASEQSERVVCSTRETVPSGGPVTRVTPTGPGCLLVSWSPPPSATARGAITSYKVQWRRQNQSSIHFQLLPSHIHQYRISGLEPGEKYLVRVMGATALGWPALGESQDWTTVSLPPGPPPGGRGGESGGSRQPPGGVGEDGTGGGGTSPPRPPAPLALTHLNQTTLRLDWNYNRTADQIDGFIVTYTKIGGEGFGNATIPADATSYTVTDLDKDSWYEISLKAYFGQLVGEDCTETVYVGGKEDEAEEGNAGGEGGDTLLLPPPSLYEAAPLSPSVIRVSWRPPPHTAVSHYTVEISSGGKVIRTKDVNETTVAEVDGLEGNSAYEVRVRAHNNGGGGGGKFASSAYSAKLESRTPPYLLSPVEGLSAVPVNSSSVLVSWSPLAVPVTGYQLLYTRDLATPLDLWHTRQLSPNQTSVLLSGLKVVTGGGHYIARLRGLGPTGAGPLSADLVFSLPPPQQQPPPGGGDAGAPGGGPPTGGGGQSSGSHKSSSSSSSSSATSASSSGSSLSAQILGILVGCSISFVLVLGCSLALLCRKRCCSKGSNRRRGVGSSAGATNHPSSLHHEMTALTTLQTKEVIGGGIRNGQINGLKTYPNGRLPNGRLPNGGHTSLRITENPQVERLTSRERDENEESERHREADSLLNDTQITMVELSQQTG